MERVAEFVELRVVGAVAVAAGLRDVVLAEVLPLEIGVDLGQRLLADPTIAARRQLPGIALLFEVTRFLQ